MSRKSIERVRIDTVEVDERVAPFISSVHQSDGKYRVRLKVGLCVKLHPLETEQEYHEAIVNAGAGANPAFIYGDEPYGPVSPHVVRLNLNRIDPGDEYPWSNEGYAHSVSVGKGENKTLTPAAVERAVGSLALRFCYCPDCVRHITRCVEAGVEVLIPSPYSPGTFVPAEAWNLRRQVAIVNGIPFWPNDVDERIDACLDGRDLWPLPTLPFLDQTRLAARAAWQLPAGFQDANEEASL